jgi:hypothetical protein
MDNSTVKETWIDKLVDELVDAKNDVSNVNSDYAYLSAAKKELEKANNTLVDTILDCTRLNYDGEELRIDDETALIYLLKIAYPDEYRERLEELKEDRKTYTEAKAEVAATEEA